jgi:hypothetical protein
MCPVSVLAKPRKGKAVTRNRVEVQEARINNAANGKCEPERSVSFFKRQSTPTGRYTYGRRLVKIVQYNLTGQKQEKCYNWGN